MKARLLPLAVILSLLIPGVASGHLITRPKTDSRADIHASQTANLAHARYVCRHGANRHQRWSCKAIVWLEREWRQTLPTPSIRTYVMLHHPCLHGIIRWENRTYDPTLDYGGGHGNIYEAYGIPQANPGTKMSSAGDDWRTNPWTQIRWMRDYAVGRYGSECGALSYRMAHGYY